MRFHRMLAQNAGIMLAVVFYFHARPHLSWLALFSKVSCLFFASLSVHIMGVMVRPGTGYALEYDSHAASATETGITVLLNRSVIYETFRSIASIHARCYSDLVL